MDNLEKYLKNNQRHLQDSFDWNKEEALWDKIEAKLEQQARPTAQKTSPMLGKSEEKNKGITITYKNLWRIAAVIAFFVLGYTALRYNFEEQQKEVVNKEIQKINPELAEVEAYYTSLIEEKQKEIQKLEPKVFQEFEKDFAKLDSSYQQLKKELLQSPNQEQVSSAMIQNLRLRIEILERQIELLEKIHQPSKQQANESIIL
ncbi:MAG: hypothetical protein OHK0045_06840 [Raineya sp.]